MRHDAEVLGRMLGVTLLACTSPCFTIHFSPSTCRVQRTGGHGDRSRGQRVTAPKDYQVKAIIGALMGRCRMWLGPVVGACRWAEGG